MSQAAPKRAARRASLGFGAWLVLGCHALGLVLFAPRMATITDELYYVHQAVVFAAGETTVELFDPVTLEREHKPPSPYPPGTSLLLTPLIAAFGPSAAPWLGFLSLLLTVWLCGRLIARLGGHPGFAVLLAVFLPSAVLCRHGMSDLPSGALLAASTWLFFTGAEIESTTPTSAAGLRWFFAGLLAGASALLREPNPLLMAPLFAGAAVRRERGVLALATGGLVGLALRPLVMLLLFDAPFAVMGHPGFSPRNLVTHLPFYLLLGSVLLPGGIPATLAYRGPRWPELIATSVLWLLFFGSYAYAGEASGLSKALVLGGRFLIPIAPLWTVCVALVAPGALSALARKLPRPLRALDGQALVTLGQAVLAGLVLALHAVMGQWNAAQADMRDAVYAHTPEGATVIPLPGARKLVNPLYGMRRVVPMQHVARRDGTLAKLLARGDLFVVEFTRDDSEHWRRIADFNRELREAVTALGPSEQVFELRPTENDHLSIWRVHGGEP